MASENTLSLVEELTDSNIREMGGDTVARRVYGLIQSFPEHEALSAGQSADLEALLAVVDRGDQVLTEGTKILKAVKLIMLGKLGLFKRAIEESTAIYAEEPDWTNAVGVANAYKRAGDSSNAIRMFLEALEHDRQDLSALLEIGDLYLQADQFVEALASYKAALEKDSTHPWASPSALYCQYRLTKDQECLGQLQRMAEGEDCDCGVAGILAQITGNTAESQAAARARSLLDRLPS